jgi:phytoene synthase
MLLPRRMRESAVALYAFCRLADDAIDVPEGTAPGLPQLRAQLDRVYANAPLPDPVERLLASTVHDYHIPRPLLDALLEGFEWDLAGRRYDSVGELDAYCARVAGSVGVIMTLLMGVRDGAVLARASDLGVAMQLTNIARDVGQDARAGRLYLPLCWLREAGIDPDAWLSRPVFTPQLAAVIERLLSRADELYARAASGIGALPARARPGIHAARLLYSSIGHDLRQHGHDAVSRRAHVRTGRKLALLLAAMGAAARARLGQPGPALEAADFLLHAVQNVMAPVADGARDAPWHGVRPPQQGRAEWLLELFERLQRRDQEMASEPLRL